MLGLARHSRLGAPLRALLSAVAAAVLMGCGSDPDTIFEPSYGAGGAAPAGGATSGVGGAPAVSTAAPSGGSAGSGAPPFCRSSAECPPDLFCDGPTARCVPCGPDDGCAGSPLACPGEEIRFAGAPACAVVSGDTTGAESKLTECSGDAGDLVYTFVAPSTGTVTAWLDPGFADDGLSVRRDDCATRNVACTGTSEPGADVTFDADASTTYFVFVDGNAPGDEGPFTLHVCYQ